MAKAFPGPIERGCEASDNVPDAVQPLSGYCDPPCDVLDVPDLALDPDQRDIQLPPILPPRSVSTVAGFCQTQPGGVTSVGSNSTTDMDEDSSIWERANNATAPVRSEVTELVRMAYDGGDEIAAFFRTKQYDSCGGLIRILGEDKRTLADVGGCPEPEFDAYFGTSGNLDANQIANGTISNEEFEALLGVVGPIQDQIDDKQDHSPELDAIAGASENGILVRIGPGNYAFRVIQVTGLSITNANGVAGDPIIESAPAETPPIADYSLADSKIVFRENVSFSWDGGGGAPAVDAGFQVGVTRDGVIVEAILVASTSAGVRVSDSLTITLTRVDASGAAVAIGTIALSAAAYNHDTTLSGWTNLDLVNGDCIRAQLTAAGTTATRISLVLRVENLQPGSS